MNKKSLIPVLLLISTSTVANMITISNEGHYDQVIKNNKPVVVEFSADWCSVCKGIDKPLQEVAQNPEFAHVTFARVDIDNLTEISKQNGIIGVPTFMYVENGKKVKEEVGIQDMTTFKDHLCNNIRKTFKVAFLDKKPSDAKTPGLLQPITDIAEKVEEVVPSIMPEQEKEKPMPVEEKQNWFMQIIGYIKALIVYVITTIQGWCKTIIDIIKGWFGQ